jgi:sec-independent protein translocase protein TatC
MPFIIQNTQNGRASKCIYLDMYARRVHFKLSIFYGNLEFIGPALYEKEKKNIFYFLLLNPFFSWVLFGYLVIPMSVNFVATLLLVTLLKPIYRLYIGWSNISPSKWTLF